MKTVLLIAIDTIRELLHHRLLLAMVLVSLGLIFISSVLFSATRKQIAHQGYDNLSEAKQREMRKALEMAGSVYQAGFYQVASLGGSLIALFIFCTAVSSEIRKGTIRVTLSKPVSRTQFLLGKYFGGVIVMVGYSAVARVAMDLFAQYHQMELSPAIKFHSWMMLCEHLMVGSVGMLLSLFVHPLIAAILAYFASASLLSPPNPLYFILPSYDRYNLFLSILKRSSSLMDVKDVVLLSLYTIDFIAIVLLFALWRFRSKELV